MQKTKRVSEFNQGSGLLVTAYLINHQPLESEIALQDQIDLQLAGHTHEGQIFPGNLITKLIYELDWGYMKKGDYNLIVSSGYGTWGPPLRIGTHSEIVCATINFGNNYKSHLYRSEEELIILSTRITTRKYIKGQKRKSGSR